MNLRYILCYLLSITNKSGIEERLGDQKEIQDSAKEEGKDINESAYIYNEGKLLFK